MRHIAVVTASGIGDALILHTVSYHLQKLGCKVTTFSNHLDGFGPWLQGYTFKPQPIANQIEELFLPFDAVFLQHDNTEKAKRIYALTIPVYTFYGSHHIGKHGPLKKTDFVCDPHQTMVANLTLAMTQFFGSSSKENGLIAPKGLIPHRFPKRIAIHPTSASLEKNWPKEKFLKLAKQLKQKGYDPVFTVSPEECGQWDAPLFRTLADLASFLYESGGFIGNDSGTGHLASYLHLPCLTLGKDQRHLKLWGPGWGKSKIITPPKYLSRWWKLFISEKKVIKELKEMGL